VTPTPPSLARSIVQGLADDPEALRELRRLLDIPEAGAQRLLTPEQAAEQLGIAASTLRKAARDGRVVGAHRQGVKLWRFRADQLELLPPAPRDLGTPGLGRGQRRATRSAAALAITGAKR